MYETGHSPEALTGIMRLRKCVSCDLLKILYLCRYNNT